jgi:hypothetical protein
MTTRVTLPREGLTVGLIAYLSVAAFYALFDLLAIRGAFHTVNLLGRAVFRGLRDPAVLLLPVQLDTGAIFLYNGLHLVLSLLIGIIVTRLVIQAERHPAQAMPVLAFIVAGFVATVLLVGYLTQPMRPVLPWWSIVVANALAVLLAAAYLLHRHPWLWRRFVPVA